MGRKYLSVTCFSGLPRRRDNTIFPLKKLPRKVVKVVKVKMVKMNFGFGHLLTIYKYKYLLYSADFDTLKNDFDK